jgi:uncharacterized RDD family membrane protein YckC
VTNEVITVPTGLTTDGLISRRYLARFIDSLIIALITLAIIKIEAAFLPGIRSGLTAIAVNLLFLLVVWIGYGTLLESSAWQATIGKKIMGLRVYNSRGGRLRLFQAAGRNLCKDGPFIALRLVPGGDVLSVVWLGAHVVVLHRSPVYQAIHDRAAHTWVAAPESTIQLHLT